MALRTPLMRAAALAKSSPVSSPLGLARMASTQSYSERMKAKGRPLSPALEIYAFPPTALSSITVRVTGVALSMGCFGVGALALVHPDIAMLISGVANSSVAPVAKFAVAFPLAYHYLGAVRHTVWDSFPETVTNGTAHSSSFALFGLATAGAGAVSLMSFEKKEKEEKK